MAGSSTISECGADRRFARVAFTGRLTHVAARTAHAAIRERGGRVVTEIDEHTTMLVVGARGAPILPDGSLCQRLLRATTLRRAGISIEVMTETAFVALADLDSPQPAPSKRYPRDQVADLIGLSSRAIERWELLSLVDSINGRFDFQDIVALRTIAGLVARGVAPQCIARAVRGWRRVLPMYERPLAQLRLHVCDGALYAEIEDTFVAPDGQHVLRFDLFGAETVSDDLSTPTHDGWYVAGGFADDTHCWSAGDWHDHALALEEEGRWAESIDSYRRALAMDAHFPSVHFNLGYLLRGIDRLEAAEAHLQLAVAQDPNFHVAWYVLADVQQRLGLADDALDSLHVALEHCPTWAESRDQTACVSRTAPIA